MNRYKVITNNLVIKFERMNIHVYRSSSITSTFLLRLFVSEWFAFCKFEIYVGLFSPRSKRSRLQVNIQDYAWLTLNMFEIYIYFVLIAEAQVWTYIVHICRHTCFAKISLWMQNYVLIMSYENFCKIINSNMTNNRILLSQTWQSLCWIKNWSKRMKFEKVMERD